MSPKQPLFMLEFNELSPTLLDEFMAAGHLPNFTKLYESSEIFLTDSQAAAPYLEPWVQWPTVHLGVSHESHRIVHLGDDPAQDSPLLGEVLSAAGVKVGICSSMNVDYKELDGFFIPDAWNARSRPRPERLSAFHDAVATQVQESSRSETVGRSSLVKLGAFLLRSGLSLKTVKLVLSQLWDERGDGSVRWRRASLLDHLQYDVFKHLVRKDDVAFATFFSNSTAHYQHYYWRHMRPELFEQGPQDDESPSLEGAILFGYQSMDRLLGRFLSDFPDVRLVFATGLSQEPWSSTAKTMYRPHKFDDMLRFAGIDTRLVEIHPVMAEEFSVKFPSSEAAQAGQRKLADLVVRDGRPLMKTDLRDDSVFTGCALIDVTDAQAEVIAPDGSSVPLSSLFYRIHTVRSGWHNPIGALWVRNHHHTVHEEPVLLTDIAPTVLAHFDVDPATSMTGSPLALAS